MDVVQGGARLLWPGYVTMGKCLWEGTGQLSNVGKCSIWQGRFGDVAGFRGLGFRLGKRMFEEL